MRNSCAVAVDGTGWLQAATWAIFTPKDVVQQMVRLDFYPSKAQWSLSVPPVQHSQILRSAHTSVFICFVWISEETAIISLYNNN